MVTVATVAMLTQDSFVISRFIYAGGTLYEIKRILETEIGIQMCRYNQQTCSLTKKKKKDPCNLLRGTCAVFYNV